MVRETSPQGYPLAIESCHGEDPELSSDGIGEGEDEQCFCHRGSERRHANEQPTHICARRCSTADSYQHARRPRRRIDRLIRLNVSGSTNSHSAFVRSFLFPQQPACHPSWYAICDRANSFEDLYHPSNSGWISRCHEEDLCAPCLQIIHLVCV